jgi:hypothetical protein
LGDDLRLGVDLRLGIGLGVYDPFVFVVEGYQDGRENWLPVFQVMSLSPRLRFDPPGWLVI